MKIQMFLLNTYGYDGYQKWHTTSLASIANYCDRHNIKLNIINENDYRIRQLIGGYNFYPFMRKMIRFYEAVKSGADYCIFMDMDTLILNMERDVKSEIEQGCEYINGGDLTIEYLTSSGDQYQHWVNCLIVSARTLIGALDNHLWKCDSGHAIFSAKFCNDFISFLGEHNLDLTTQSGIDNLASYDRMITMESGLQIHDEHLLSFFMTKNNNFNNYKIKSLLCDDTRICSSHYHVGARYSGQNEPEEFAQNLYQIACCDCIFHHLVMAKHKVDSYMRMFKK